MSSYYFMSSTKLAFVIHDPRNNVAMAGRKGGGCVVQMWPFMLGEEGKAAMNSFSSVALGRKGVSRQLRNADNRQLGMKKGEARRAASLPSSFPRFLHKAVFLARPIHPTASTASKSDVKGKSALRSGASKT